MKVKVTADRLHVRAGEGVAFDSIGFVSADEELFVNEIGDGVWLHVTVLKKNGISGWVCGKYVVPVVDQVPPWLNIAAREVGVRERVGRDNNHPRIQEYLATVGNLSEIDKSRDETPWCSCFMNWCVEQAGYFGTDSAAAKSWGNWRIGVDSGDGRPGDIAVFDRKTVDPKQSGGHVGILIEHDKTAGKVLILGGNQSNSVRYTWFPIDGTSRGGTHYRLLSCRRI